MAVCQNEKQHRNRPVQAAGCDTAVAERLVQKAFVVRARTFGLDHATTKTARENLLKCYLALNESEDVRELRDAPVTHLQRLITKLDAYDSKVATTGAACLWRRVIGVCVGAVTGCPWLERCSLARFAQRL